MELQSKKCSNSCAVVTSCSDGTLNCGEVCEQGCTGAMTKCNPTCSGSATSCGDWTPNCGEAVNTCRADVCGTSSSRYNMNDLIGGNLAIGGSVYQATCGLGTGFTGSNDDWFQVTTGQPGYLRLELFDIGFDCDWDLYVYNTGLTELYNSRKTDCMETKTSPSILPAGTYLIRVNRYASAITPGNGQGYLRAKLWECVSDGDCGYTAGHIKRKCDCPLADCGQNELIVTDYTCADPTECLGNAECDSNYCCKKESPQGPGISPGTCESVSNIQNPWICA